MHSLVKVREFGNSATFEYRGVLIARTKDSRRNSYRYTASANDRMLSSSALRKGGNTLDGPLLPQIDKALDN